MKKLILGILFIGLFAMADAQITTPAPSPKSTVKQTIGLTDVTVEYSRPSVKGRTIFGDLVPYNQLWRTGANESTDITFSDDVVFGGKSVAAGTYALYTFPGENQWRVILYEDADLWGSPGDNFDQGKVVAQAEVEPTAFEGIIESFSIGFDHLRNNSAHLTMGWENTMVSVPIEVHTKTKVEESIENVFSGPSANDYHSAASYYLEEGMDLEKAHKWSSKAVEMNPEAFWMMKVKAEIEAALGNYDQAITTAEQSAKAAEKAGNKQYVGFNNENIAKWKKMK